MEEPTVIIFHMSWASRHQPKYNIPPMFMGEPMSAETGKYHPETTEITFSRDNGRDSSLRSIFSFWSIFSLWSIFSRTQSRTLGYVNWSRRPTLEYVHWSICGLVVPDHTHQSVCTRVHAPEYIYWRMCTGVGRLLQSICIRMHALGHMCCSMCTRACAPEYVHWSICTGVIAPEFVHWTHNDQQWLM
jgi:hypothetical protein